MNMKKEEWLKKGYAINASLNRPDMAVTGMIKYIIIEKRKRL